MAGFVGLLPVTLLGQVQIPVTTAATRTLPEVAGDGVYIELYNGVGGGQAPAPATIAGLTNNGATLSPFIDFPRPGTVSSVGNSFSRFFASTAVPPDQVRTLAARNFTLRLQFFLKITRALDRATNTSPIDVRVGVGSDDGFHLAIGTNYVGQAGVRGFAFSYYNLAFEDEGLYPVNLMYAANASGESGLEFRWRTGTNTVDVIVPQASLYLSTNNTENLITFETLAAGTDVNIQFRPLGIKFERVSGGLQVTSSKPSEFVPISPTRVYGDPATNATTPGVVDLRFVVPGTDILSTTSFLSFYMIDAETNGATVQAFDPAGNLVFTNAYHSGGASQESVIIDYPRIARVRVTLGEGEDTAALDNVRFRTPASLPDLVASDLISPARATAGQPVQISWRVTNEGPIPTDVPWSDILAVSPAADGQNALRLGSFRQSQSLAPEQWLVQTQTVILPPTLAGKYFLIVTTDGLDEIREANNPTNNTSVAALPIQIDAPDLVVNSVTVPSSGVFGQPAEVTWVVGNIGTAPATANWADRLYLLNETAPSQSIPLLTRSATDRVGLGPGAIYTRTSQVLLPITAALGPGRYHLLVVTDDGNAQAEPNETNNFLTSAALDLVRPPLPDLAVLDAAIAPSGFAGEAVPVSWMVANAGVATATAPWTETIALSRDLAAGGDLLLAEVVIREDLPPGASLVRTQTVVIPNGISGRHWMLVSINADRAVFESDMSNNLLVDDRPFDIPAELKLQFPLSELAERTTNYWVHGTVSRNGESALPLSVIISSDNTNELVVPAAVTIPAGQLNTGFDAVVMADHVVDGSKVVHLTASAPGLLSGEMDLVVRDVDRPKLGLSITPEAVKEGTTFSATITCNVVSTNRLSVALIPSNARRLFAPQTVMIEPNQTSATFDLAAANNDFIESTQRVSLTAQAPGFDSAVDSIAIADDDYPAFDLEPEALTISEGAGALATRVRLTRHPLTNRPLTVQLRSSDPKIAAVSRALVVPANEASVVFPVAAVDNDFVNGSRQVTLAAFMADPVTEEPLGLAYQTTLNVTDDDGPTLKVTITKKLIAEGVPAGSTGTVSRNTGSTTPLIVQLASSNRGEAVVPASVTIAANQSSVTFAIDSVTDNVTDGNQSVAITATAPGFIGGSATLIVTDGNVPDLIVAGLSSPSAGLTESSAEITFRVVNAGLAGFTGTSIQRVWLSSDPLPGDDTVLGDYEFSGTLQAGQTSERQLRFNLPIAPGDYWIIVAADFTDLVSEALEDNNWIVSNEPIHVQAAYSATVAAEIETAAAGTQVPLRGRAFTPQGGPVSGVPVRIAVDLRGTRRFLTVTTDASGQFSTVFQPLPYEAGLYQVRAMHPGVEQISVQDEFILLGMRVQPQEISARIGAFTVVSNRVALVNSTELPLTRLDATVINGPVDADIEVRLPDSMPGNGQVPVEIVVHSRADFDLNDTLLIRFSSAERAVAELPFHVRFVAQQARVVAKPELLAAGMVRGEQTMFEFEIANEGGRDTGPLDVLLPQAPWLRLASPSPLSSLAPGASTRVTLQLLPQSDLPLTAQNGSLVIAGADHSVRVPFSFTALSRAVGSFALEAVDEFTFYAEGAPRIADASVLLRNADTAEVVARGATDATGRFSTNGIPEGYYVAEVTATNHLTFRKTFLLSAGQENKTEAFLSRQVVRYVWTVEPVPFEDRYRITIQSQFETIVPVPVVTVEPKVIDLADMKGDIMQVNLQVSNHGLIAAQGLRLNLPQDPRFTFEPITSDLGNLAAQSTIVVPLLIRRIAPVQTVLALSFAHATLADAANPDPAGSEECVKTGGFLWTLLCGDRPRTYAEPIAFQNLGKDCIGPLPPRRDPPMPVWRRLTGGPINGRPGATGQSDDSGELPIVHPQIHEKDARICAPCDPNTFEGDHWNVSFSYVLQPLISAVEKVVEQMPFVADTDSTLDAKGDAETCCTDEGRVGVGVHGSAKGNLEAKFIILGGKLPGIKAERTFGGTTVKAEGKFYGGLTVTTIGEFSGEAGSGCNFSDPYAHARGAIDVHIGGEIKAKVAVAISGPMPEGMPESQRSFTVWSGLGVFTGGKVAAKYDLVEGFSWESRCFDGAYYQGKIVIDLPGTDWDLSWPKGDSDIYYFIDPNCVTNSALMSATFTDATQAAVEAEIRSRLDQFFRMRTAADQIAVALQAPGIGQADRRPSRLFSSGPRAAAPAGGVCARVRLQLDQDLVVTRTALNATLELVNNSPDQPLDDLSAEIDVTDISGNVVNELFGVRAPELNGLTSVDGTGRIAAGSSGRAAWLLFPSPDAAAEGPTPYAVSGLLTYTLGGRRLTVPLDPVLISVWPDAKLRLKYFHQRDVFSDDPFTPEIEPAEPFSLGVLIENVGMGTARNVRITSAQPKIVENEKGLLAGFKIVGAQVDGREVMPSLTALFGNIIPGQISVGQWLFVSTVHGQFIDYAAKFEHLDSLGDPRLSLIDRVEIHEMVHAVRAQYPADDGLPDFLVNDIPNGGNLPDTLYLSDGTVQDVSLASGATTEQRPAATNLIARIAAPSAAGWTYLKMPDPATGQYRLVRVVRSDGVEIRLDDNVWVTDRTFIENSRRPIREFNLHLLDHDSTGIYTLTYEPRPLADITPPETAIAALPPQSSSQMLLHWSGNDGPNGSGIAWYDVYVSANGGPFALWLSGARTTSALFSGELNSTYAFYSVATDHAGNAEAPPFTPDTVTTTSLVNAAPKLDAGSDQIVNEGATVTIQCAATDDDGVAGVLAFALEPGAPEGAAIDSRTGRITWPTSERTGPSTNRFVVRVSDNGFPSLSATSAVTVVVREINSPPALAPIPSQIINEGAWLTFTATATDQDLPRNSLIYSLGSGAPEGTSVSPLSGVFSWRPNEFQGPSTNVIQLIVTDDGTPTLSAVQTFTVRVRDVLNDLALNIGSTNVITGEAASVPIQLFSSSEVTNLTFILDLSTERLTNLVVRPVAAEVLTSTIQPLSPSRAAVSFALDDTLTTSARRDIAQLDFGALPFEQSEIVPLRLLDLTAVRSGGIPVAKPVGFGGRVFVIGREPILDAAQSSNGIVSLHLYGWSGTNYRLQSSANLSPPNWTNALFLQLTNALQSIDQLPTFGPQRFWRAVQE